MFKRLWGILLIIVVIIVGANYKNIIKLFYPIKYESTVLKYSKEYELNPYLIYSLIRVESKFDTQAISPKDARGLMQITSQTGRYISKLLSESDFNEAMLLTPDTNIKYGAFYFRKLLKDFDNNMNCALAAYNGGEGNVRKWIKTNSNGQNALNITDIPFSETRQYLKRVNKYFSIYKFLYSN
jgi:soluble lytic murein transglycosylase